MKIKINDKVKIIAGRDSGKSGKVIKSLPYLGKVVIEGLNTVSRHTKANRGSSRGQKITVAMPIDVSNTMLICPNCGKETRVGYLVTESGDKTRICKKCKQPLSDKASDNK